MKRLVLRLAALAVVASVGTAHAVIIDPFEEGGFSLTNSGNPENPGRTIEQRNLSSVLGRVRIADVFMWSGTLSTATLAPDEPNVIDDGVTISVAPQTNAALYRMALLSVTCFAV